jgi:predicted nucleic acid-binding protein
VRLVIDASVTLKWFFHDRPGEDDCGKALDILLALEANETEAMQPPHWLAEVLGVVARETPHLVDKTLTTLAHLGLPVIDDEDVFRRAARLSIAYDHHLFDTLYHALALECGAVCVTADARYFAKTRQVGHIALLAEFDPA